MRFRATPFSHPEYLALKAKTELWATVWWMGHLCFIVYLAVGCSMPVALALVALIVPETRGRMLSLGGSTMAGSLSIAAAGFAAKVYANRKGRRQRPETADGNRHDHG